jgi:hypothetical protein
LDRKINPGAKYGSIYIMKQGRPYTSVLEQITGRKNITKKQTKLHNEELINIYPLLISATHNEIKWVYKILFQDSL